MSFFSWTLLIAGFVMGVIYLVPTVVLVLNRQWTPEHNLKLMFLAWLAGGAIIFAGSLDALTVPQAVGLMVVDWIVPTGALMFWIRSGIRKRRREEAESRVPVDEDLRWNLKRKPGA